MASKCVYCDAAESNTLFSTTDVFDEQWEIEKCHSCYAYFLSPHPTDAQLARAYDDSYYGEGEEKFEGIVEKFINIFRHQRANRLAKHLNRKGKVLDIGCGNGKFLRFLQQKGNFETHGLEMPGGSANRAAKVPGLQLKMGALQEGDYPKDSLDGVTLFHVFEHLTEPKKTLEIVSDILRKGGVLMISFPNIDSWQACFFKDKWLHLDPPRHLFFFTPTDFKNEMKKLGFEVIEERHFQVEYNPYGTLQSLLNLVYKKREVLYEHLKGNKEYVKEYGKLNLFLQKLFFMGSFPFFIVTDWVSSWFKKSGTVEFILRKN